MPLRTHSLAVLLALGLGAAGCGAPLATSSSAVAPPEARLASLTAQDAQLARVSWRLMLANTDLCPAIRPQAGWALQSAAQYGAELRPLAERRFGLSGDLPGVLLAPENSPAARASLAPGDLILSINDQPMSEGATQGTESYDGLQANLDRLDAALASRPARVSVRRGETTRTVEVTPVPACAYTTQIVIQRSLRGNVGHGLIQITTGMAALAQNDDELAFIVAHELAHAVLEHVSGPATPGQRGAQADALSLKRGPHATMEADADRLGLYLLARAGYDPAAAVVVLDRYSAQDLFSAWPQIDPRGRVYAPSAERRAALAPALADIAARQAAGRELIP